MSSTLFVLRELLRTHANIYYGSEFAAYDDEEVRLQVTYAMFVIANETIALSWSELP